MFNLIQRTVFYRTLPIFLLLTGLNVRSQTLSYFLVNATLITYSDDTLNTIIKFGNEFNLQFTITATDTITDRDTIYSPREIKQFYYIVNKDTVSYFSKNSPIDQISVFMKLLYHGKKDLYQFVTLNKKKAPMVLQVEYFIWNNGWELPAISPDNELESLLAHFSNCFELQYKIKSHEYGLQQIKRIIQEYENCKLTDDKYEFFNE